jgi:tagatose 6-phosphate kinase
MPESNCFWRYKGYGKSCSLKVLTAAGLSARQAQLDYRPILRSSYSNKRGNWKWKSTMILCVNLNAAIDRTVIVENYTLDAIHRSRKTLALPGGKGCNCARVFKTLGAQPVVTGWAAGYGGKFIESGLRAEGISTSLVHTSGESRTCYSIIDPVRRTLTEVYEASQPVTGFDRVRFERVYKKLISVCELVTLSGSLPGGLPDDYYACLIQIAHKKGVPVFLDTSGEPLRLGLEQGIPTLMKPNLSELSALNRKMPQSESEILAAMMQVYLTYKTMIVVSQGKAGALAISGGHIWKAVPPEVAAISAVGSGDALLAGIAYGFSRGSPFEEAMRLGVAAGTANTLQIGAGRVDLADILRLQNEVIVSQIG